MAKLVTRNGLGTPYAPDAIRGLSLSEAARLMTVALPFMDTGVTEDIHAKWTSRDPGVGPAGDREFLARYLEQSSADLMIP